MKMPKKIRVGKYVYKRHHKKHHLKHHKKRAHRGFNPAKGFHV